MDTWVSMHAGVCILVQVQSLDDPTAIAYCVGKDVVRSATICVDIVRELLSLMSFHRY